MCIELGNYVHLNLVILVFAVANGIFSGPPLNFLVFYIDMVSKLTLWTPPWKKILIHIFIGTQCVWVKNLVVFAGYESVARRFLCKEIFNVHSPGYSPFTWDRRCNIPSEGHHSWTVTFPQKGLRRTDKDTRDDRETNPEHSDESQAC